MGIRTRRAKRVVQNRTMAYPGNPAHGNSAVVVMSDDPDIAVVVDDAAHAILTVLWRTTEQYTRPGKDAS